MGLLVGFWTYCSWVGCLICLLRLDGSWLLGLTFGGVAYASKFPFCAVRLLLVEFGCGCFDFGAFAQGLWVVLVRYFVGLLLWWMV